MVRRHSSGFTLIEIMVAVALVAILASIAIPSYSAYVIRGQRAAAKAALEQAAQFLERNYTISGCYSFTDVTGCNGGPGTAVALPATYAPNDGLAAYVIALGPLPAGAAPGQGFSVTATPCGTAGSCPNGSRTTFADPDCDVLTLNNIGAKTASGTIGVNNPDVCWGR